MSRYRSYCPFKLLKATLVFDMNEDEEKERSSPALNGPQDLMEESRQQSQPIKEELNKIGEELQPVNEEISFANQEHQLIPNEVFQIKEEIILLDNETIMNNQPIKDELLSEGVQHNNHVIQPIREEFVEIKEEIIISDDEADYVNQPIKQESFSNEETTHGSNIVSKEIQYDNLNNQCYNQNMDFEKLVGIPMVTLAPQNLVIFYPQNVSTSKLETVSTSKLQNIQPREINEEDSCNEPLCLIKTENITPKSTLMDEQCQKQADDEAEKGGTFFLCNTCSEEKDRMIIFSTGLQLAKHVIAGHQSLETTGPNFQFTCYGKGVKYHCFPVVQEIIFICKIGNCSKRFGNQHLLQNHIEACHHGDGEFNLKCHYRTCNRKFTNQDDRRDHIQEFHVEYGFDIQDSYGAIWIIKCLPFGSRHISTGEEKQTRIQEQSLVEIEKFFALTYNFGSLTISSFDEFSAQLSNLDEVFLKKGRLIGPSIVALKRFETVCQASQLFEEIKLADIDFIVNIHDVQNRMLHGGVTVHNHDTDCVFFVDEIKEDSNSEKAKPFIKDLKTKDIEMDIGDLVFLYGKPDPNYSGVHDADGLYSYDDFYKDLPILKKENLCERLENPSIVLEPDENGKEKNLGLENVENDKNLLGDRRNRETLTISLDTVDQTYCFHEKFGTFEKPSSVDKNFKPNLHIEGKLKVKTEAEIEEAQMVELDVIPIDFNDNDTELALEKGKGTSKKDGNKSKLKEKKIKIKSKSLKKKNKKLNHEKNTDIVHTWTDEQIGNCISIPEIENISNTNSGNEHFDFFENFCQNEVSELLSNDTPVKGKKDNLSVSTDPVEFHEVKNIPKSTSLSSVEVEMKQDLPQSELGAIEEIEHLDNSGGNFTSIKQENGLEADISKGMEEMSSSDSDLKDKSCDHILDLKIESDISSSVKSVKSPDHINNLKMENNVNDETKSHNHLDIKMKSDLSNGQRKNANVVVKASNKLMSRQNFIMSNNSLSSCKVSKHVLNKDLRHNISKKFGLSYHSRAVNPLPFSHKKSLNILGSKVIGPKHIMSLKSVEENRNILKMLNKEENCKNNSCDNQQLANQSSDLSRLQTETIRSEESNREQINTISDIKSKKRKKESKYVSKCINGIEIKDCGVKLFKLDKSDIEYICHEMKIGHKTEYANYLYTMRRSDAKKYDQLKTCENKISFSPAKAKRILEICRNQFKMNKFFLENQNEGSLRRKLKISRKGKLKRGKLADEDDYDWTIISDESSSMSDDTDEDIKDFDLDEDEYNCPECDQSFSKLAFLESHLARKHTDIMHTERKFCPVEDCDASYSSKYSLLTHIKKDHGEEVYNEVQSELFSTKDPQTRPAGSCLMPTVWRNPQPLLPPKVKDNLTKNTEKEQPKNVREVEDIKNILSDFTQSKKGSFYSILSNK